MRVLAQAGGPCLRREFRVAFQSSSLDWVRFISGRIAGAGCGYSPTVEYYLVIKKRNVVARCGEHCV